MQFATKKKIKDKGNKAQRNMKLWCTYWTIKSKFSETAYNVKCFPLQC